MLWRGVADKHPEMIAVKLDPWCEEIVRVGLETGSAAPWLAPGLRALGLPVVVIDARRAADALKARPVKTDRADARALAEMLQTGWYTAGFVKSEESHRMKALLLSRDQLDTSTNRFPAGVTASEDLEAGSRMDAMAGGLRLASH